MSKILPSILIIGDDKEYIKKLKTIVEHYFDIYCADNIELAHHVLNNEWIQVILCAENIVNNDKAFYQINENFPEIIKLIIFEQPPLTLHIETFNQYICDDFICKSSTTLDVYLKLTSAINIFKLKRKSEQLAIELKLQPKSLKEAIDVQREALSAHFTWDSIVRSPNSCMNDVCALINQVSPFDVNVLIVGESGTGKELCAKALHYNSLRQQAPFVAENCGALPDELLESELFGHKKGAFTGAVEERIGLFESAQGGTIFLDEIGETSPAFQLKLLRVLQEKEIRPLGENKTRAIDVRVIAATNRDLAEDVRHGRFREDLYYRLATFTISLPPLRERLEDIPYLATNILNKAQIELGKKVDGFEQQAIAYLQKYSWPGNVRELENEIKRMLVITQQSKLSESLISPHIREVMLDECLQTTALNYSTDSLKAKIEMLESQIIEEALIRNKWNKSKTADELGLSRVGLRNKLERYNIKPSEHIVIPLETKISSK